MHCRKLCMQAYATNMATLAPASSRLCWQYVSRLFRIWMNSQDRRQQDVLDTKDPHYLLEYAGSHKNRDESVTRTRRIFVAYTDLSNTAGSICVSAARSGCASSKSPKSSSESPLSSWCAMESVDAGVTLYSRSPFALYGWPEKQMHQLRKDESQWNLSILSPCNQSRVRLCCVVLHYPTKHVRQLPKHLIRRHAER